MYDYKIVEQVTRKKKKLSGALKKTMSLFYLRDLLSAGL